MCSTGLLGEESVYRMLYRGLRLGKYIRDAYGFKAIESGKCVWVV